jgi:hypothetical protein
MFTGYPLPACDMSGLRRRAGVVRPQRILPFITHYQEEQ